MLLGPSIYNSEHFILPRSSAERAALRANDPSKLAEYYFDLPTKSVPTVRNSNKFTASNAVKNFYLGLGCTYLQIQEYGLFYLGRGTCPYGVTSFQPKECYVRLRLKTHGIGCVGIELSLNTPCKVLDSHPVSKFSLDPADGRPFPDFFFAN
jgi:hypothetical protein